MRNVTKATQLPKYSGHRHLIVADFVSFVTAFFVQKIPAAFCGRDYRLSKKSVTVKISQTFLV